MIDLCNDKWKRVVCMLVRECFPEPLACPLCGRAVRTVQYEKQDQQLIEILSKSYFAICQSCIANVRWIESPLCQRCGRAMQPQHTLDEASTLCSDCTRRGDTSFSFSRSAIAYNQAMKGWLSTYKFHGDRQMAQLFVALLEVAYMRYFVAEQRHTIDLITYIPLHSTRLYERTFNQAEELAQLLGGRLGISVRPLLIRKKKSEHQSHKNRHERLRSLQEAFQFDPSSLGGVDLTQVQSILLIDDVYTTGTTLVEASRILVRKYPNIKIYGLTVAR